MAFVHTLLHSIPYHDDPTAIFVTVCQNKKNSLLLESAEISSKNSLKSLLLISPAIKIVCHNNHVSFFAQSTNGKATLPLIKQRLQNISQLVTEDDNHIEVAFAPLSTNLDEDSKLQAPTVFDGLRCVVGLYAESEIPVLLGGLFSYDLVTNFIPMENIPLKDDELHCPDYVFYLAEQLLVIDHQKQQTELQTFCFDPIELPCLKQAAFEIQKKLQKIEPHLTIKPAPTTVNENLNDTQFKKIIEQLKQHIYMGDVFQIVPSRRFSIPCPDPLSSYRRLKQTNPSPYMVYMQDEDFTLFCASPESALKFNSANRQLEIYPIAGSRQEDLTQTVILILNLMPAWN